MTSTINTPATGLITLMQNGIANYICVTLSGTNPAQISYTTTQSQATCFTFVVNNNCMTTYFKASGANIYFVIGKPLTTSTTALSYPFVNYTMNNLNYYLFPSTSNLQCAFFITSYAPMTSLNISNVPNSSTTGLSNQNFIQKYLPYLIAIATVAQLYQMLTNQTTDVSTSI